MLALGQTLENSAGLSGFFPQPKEENPTGITKVSGWWIIKCALELKCCYQGTLSTLPSHRIEDKMMGCLPHHMEHNSTHVDDSNIAVIRCLAI